MYENIQLYHNIIQPYKVIYENIRLYYNIIHNAVTRYSTKGNAVTRYAVYRITCGTPSAQMAVLQTILASNVPETILLFFCFRAIRAQTEKAEYMIAKETYTIRKR